MPFWLLVAGAFAGWVLWSGSRTRPNGQRNETIAQTTQKSAGLGALTFAFLLLMRMGPWRSWALLSSAITAWPVLARFLKSDSHARANRAPVAQLTRDEAAQMLDVEANAPREEIEAAYRRLMTRVHPDAGGNAYLAQLVNEARERLLG